MHWVILGTELEYLIFVTRQLKTRRMRILMAMLLSRQLRCVYIPNYEQYSSDISPAPDLNNFHLGSVLGYGLSINFKQQAQKFAKGIMYQIIVIQGRDCMRR